MAIDIPEEDRQYINEGFAERLENNSPDRVDVIIEVEPGTLEHVINEVSPIDSYTLFPDRVAGGKFLPATVPVESVPDIARIDGVELVHQDQIAGTGGVRDFFSSLAVPNPRDFPPRRRIEESFMELFRREDPFAKGTDLGRVEQPRFNLMPTPFGDPLQASLAAIDHYTRADIYDGEFIPTNETVSWVMDDGITAGHDGQDVQVGVLDTGYTPQPPSTGNRSPRRESLVPGEPALDMNTHGSWCTNTVVGQSHPSPWGPCRGVADRSMFGHFKCLNTLPGFGMTSWILLAMDRALEWGADIINMSLGGVQQGPVDEDPYCRFIRENCKENAGDDDGAIFVVASGNAGPLEYTIGSPGISEKAITVGAYSLLDQAPAAFSSRGPSGDWYFEHPERFEEDLAEYGERELVKPDCVAPGGGRETEAKRENAPELLWQAAMGWMDGFNDGIRDGTTGMAGSSMAAPHVAGLVTRLYQAGVVDTASEFKQVISEQQSVPEFPTAADHANDFVNGKNITVGYGVARESVFNPAR